MQDLVFLILCLLSIININFKGINEFYYDYMNLKNTNQIKGIFVWMIILYHNRIYFRDDKKYIYNSILDCVGQKMVSLFLFYSGFGICESINYKGINYVKYLPKKGIILFIKTQIIIFIFLVTNIFLGIKTSLYNYFLSIIFKSSIGNSNWFAFSIILFYFYSFLSFIFIKKRKYYFLGIIFISILCSFHNYFTYNFYYPKVRHTVDNTLTFIIGFWYSLSKKYFENYVLKNDKFFYGSLSFSIIIYYNYYSNRLKTVWIVSITNAIFSLIVVLISMKVRFRNEFLTLLNSHSYSIYLLQRIVMRFVKIKKYFKKNEFIRFFSEFSIILFISIIFDDYTHFIDNIFNNKNEKKNLYNDDTIYLIDNIFNKKIENKINLFSNKEDIKVINDDIKK